MDREKLGRAHLKSNQDLRDFLDYHSFPTYKEFASKDVSLALSSLHAYVEILCEMTKRLWDELEGHQDVCRMQKHIDEEIKKLTQGFGYRREYAEHPRFTEWKKSQRIEMKPCGYIDNDADDGWGMSSTCAQSFDDLTKTIEKARGEKMDKQIRKVEKDVKKGNKMKAEKDIKVLKKMDKKFDKKIDKAKKVMKKGC